jgi:hypothetical protein
MDALRELKRRTFLKAVGLGCSAPLALSMARRVEAAPSARPARLLVAFFPNGVPPEHFTPLGSGSDFDLRAGEAVLAPFERYKQSLNVYLGMQIGGGEENHDAISQLLLPGREQGRSFEHVVASALGVRPILLGAVPMKSAGDQVSSGAKNVIFRDGDWVRSDENPIRAAAALLGQAPIIAAQTGSPSDDDAAFREQVLALTEGELERLQRELAQLTTERGKLALHLQAVSELRASSKNADSIMCSAAPSLPFVDALRGPSRAGADQDFFFSESNLEAIYLAQLEVAAQALVCGSARVVGLQVSYGVSENVWSFVPGTQSGDQFHGTLSHGDGSKPEIRARFARSKRWLNERFEERVRRLLDQPDPLDPAHSVLDNTLVFLCSELADGSMHNTNTKTMYLGNDQTTISTQLPFVSLGGAAGALRTGRVWTFDNRRHVDLLMTFCQLLGARGSDFGAFTPIAELNT